jgi:hypothetical protein
MSPKEEDGKDKKVKKEKDLKDPPSKDLFTPDWPFLSLRSSKTLEKVSHPATSSDTSRLTAFDAMAVNKRPSFGGIFFGGISPSKIGHVAPFLATIQALSKTRVFLLSKKKRRLLCMGRTFTANKPLPLI